MPAAYDVTSRHFDDLMTEVCPGAREETHLRIHAWAAAGALIALDRYIEAGVAPMRSELEASKERARLAESLGLKR